MPVVVPRSHTHHPDPGRGTRVQPRRLVRAAVVGDLDHVHPVDVARGEDRLLRPLAEVPEQQRAQASARTAADRREGDRHARVVAGFRRSGSRARPEHLPAQLAECPRRAADDLFDRRAPLPQVGDQPLVPRLARRADQGAVDAAENRLRAADVVEVEVAEHEQVDARDAEVIEAGRERLGIRPRVDERHHVGAAHEHRVALPDVAGGDLPVGGSCEHLHRADARGRAHETDQRQQRHAPRHRPGASRHRGEGGHEGAHRDHEEQHDPRRTGRPGQRRTGQPREEVRDGRDPGRGQPGHGGDRAAEPRSDGQQQAGEQPEHRRQGCGRFGQGIGDHPVERDAGCEQQEHRLAGQLGAERHRDDHGQPSRKPAREQAGERGSDHQEPAGGEHRQREAVVAAQPGVGAEQQQHGQREHRDPAHRPPGADGQQHDHRHRRGAHHTRLRRDEHHEAHEHQHGSRDPHPPRDAGQGPEEQHEADHDRAVRAGHSGQVAER